MACNNVLSELCFLLLNLWELTFQRLQSGHRVSGSATTSVMAAPALMEPSASSLMVLIVCVQKRIV